MQVRKNLKLAPKYFGPFLIEAKTRAVAYRLKLPHSSLLKIKIGHWHTPSPTLSVYNDYGLCRFIQLPSWPHVSSPPQRSYSSTHHPVGRFFTYGGNLRRLLQYRSSVPDFLPNPRGQDSNSKGQCCDLSWKKKAKHHHTITINHNRQIKGLITNSDDGILRKLGHSDLRETTSCH